MAVADEPGEAQARRWRIYSSTHSFISGRVGSALQEAVELSLVEYNVLDFLDRRDGVVLRMQDVSTAISMSQSAATRLVARLEERGAVLRSLSADDRRGVATQLTDEGRKILAAARPIYHAALDEAIASAELVHPGMKEIVDLLRLPRP